MRLERLFSCILLHPLASVLPENDPLIRSRKFLVRKILRPALARFGGLPLSCFLTNRF